MNNFLNEFGTIDQKQSFPESRLVTLLRVATRRIRIKDLWNMSQNGNLNRLLSTVIIDFNIVAVFGDVDEEVEVIGHSRMAMQVVYMDYTTIHIF